MEVIRLASLQSGHNRMLIPFRKDHAEQVFVWQTLPEYRDAFRQIDRLMTIEECENLQHFLGSEVLLYYADSLAGMMILTYHPHGVVEMGFLVLKEYQNKGHALKMAEETQEYLKNKRNMRKAVAYVLAENDRLRKMCVKNGFDEKCKLDKHTFIHGEYRDVILIEKFL